MFDLNLDRFKNNIALIDKEGFITYTQLEELVSNFSIEGKKLIAIEMKPTIEHIAFYLGALRKGHSVLMIDANLDKTLKENIYKAYQPNFIFKDKLIEFNKKELKIYKDLALLLPTSGSTGSIKYVRLTKKNLYANAISIINYLPINSEDRAITNLPLHYSYGLSVLHTHLLVGGSIYLTNNSIITKEFWSEFEENKITNFNGVPFHYEMLERIGFLKKSYPFLRFLTQAGGKLNETLVRKFGEYAKKNNIKFFVMYGQTEATARISYLPSEFVLKKPSSIGIAIPKGEMFIQSGEICYKGENVMLGYANGAEDLAKGDELKGVLKTGDLGYQDEDGFFYVKGRAKRFIKIYGNRVNLDVIEEFLKNCNKSVVVLGDDNKIMICSLKNDKEIIDLVAKKFKFNKKIISLKVVNKFITKTNGKIDYQKMKEQCA